MTWLLYSVLAAIIWAGVNHIDKYLLEKYCKNSTPGALIIFSSLIGIPVVALIALFNPVIFNLGLFDILILIITGMIYLLAIIFYLMALDQDETSAVAPQMILIPLLSGLLSAVFLKETLSLQQIIAIVLILISSMGLSIDIKSLKINFTTFKLMFACSLLTALNTVLFKFMTGEVGFWVTALWTHVGFIIFGVICLVFYKVYRDAFVNMIIQNGSGILSVNIFSEVITIVGNLLFNYATILAPIALVQAFTEGIQPIFVFLLGVIFTIFLPKFAQEDLSIPNIIKKTVFISTMVISIIYQNLTI